MISQALRTFCVFWRRGWAAETEEAKLSLFGLLQQGASEGGTAAVSCTPPPWLLPWRTGWLASAVYLPACLRTAVGDALLVVAVFSFLTSVCLAVPVCWYVGGLV